MARKIGFIVTVLGAALAASATLGCQASFRAGSAANEPPQPPAATPATPPAQDPQQVEQQPPQQAEPQQAEQPQKPEKSEAKLDKGTVKLPAALVFEPGQPVLKAGAGNELQLEHLRLFLLENPDITKLRVEGHTDNAGEAEANEKLSGERALVVKAWLVANGIPADRVLAVGFGHKKPMANNATEEGRAQNQRVELKIAERNGKKYLGLDPTGGGKVFSN
jgi:outer membrane protein OmpA-like peptidoglycan-associated protein